MFNKTTFSLRTRYDTSVETEGSFLPLADGSRMVVYSVDHPNLQNAIP
jgi:hypothetical protein